jgi:PII-like signaling protein
MINQPMMIKIIDEQEKLEPLLLSLKQIIGDNGFIIIHKVEVV